MTYTYTYAVIPPDPDREIKAYVSRYYQVLLGREPDPEGLDAWANVLSDNSPIEAVIKGLCGSVEFGELCKLG